MLAACGQSNAEPEIVDPADYRAFFLWSGVEPRAEMAQADAVYLLWGELQRGDPARIVAMRRSVPTAQYGERWLVVRADRLDWGEGAYAQLLDAARSWDRDGRLTGVQIDFDSSTGELRNYAAFLADMRRRLPNGLKLSATGLMDWPANARDADLAAMRGALDEIVIQTYAGTTTIPEYPRYLAAAKRLGMPYRVAVVEGGEWAAPEHLASDPDFRGYVVFLLAERFRNSR